MAMAVDVASEVEAADSAEAASEVEAAASEAAAEVSDVAASTTDHERCTRLSAAHAVKKAKCLSNHEMELQYSAETALLSRKAVHRADMVDTMDHVTTHRNHPQVTWTLNKRP
jgi:hypothetical protein